MSDLAALGLRKLVGLLRGGKASPLEVAEAHLARIDALNPTSLAFISVCAEEARATAQSAGDKGPLHGAPYAVKDLFDARGLATTCGSASRRGVIAEDDAKTVALLNAAGGVLIGAAAVLLMLVHGRIAGATGILAGALLPAGIARLQDLLCRDFVAEDPGLAEHHGLLGRIEGLTLQVKDRALPLAERSTPEEMVPCLDAIHRPYP